MTHIITKAGLVKTSCTKQILFAIMTLEKNLQDVINEIKACEEHGLDAFLPSYQQERLQIEIEISTLLDCLNNKYNTLINR